MATEKSQSNSNTPGINLGSASFLTNPSKPLDSHPSQASYKQGSGNFPNTPNVNKSDRLAVLSSFFGSNSKNLPTNFGSSSEFLKAVDARESLGRIEPNCLANLSGSRQECGGNPIESSLHAYDTVSGFDNCINQQIQDLLERQSKVIQQLQHRV
jgi:hypothetical protein